MIQIIYNSFRKERDLSTDEKRRKKTRKFKTYYCYYCYMSTQEVPLSWTLALYNRGQSCSTLEMSANKGRKKCCPRSNLAQDLYIWPNPMVLVWRVNFKAQSSIQNNFGKLWVPKRVHAKRPYIYI